MFGPGGAQCLRSHDTALKAERSALLSLDPITSSSCLVKSRPSADPPPLTPPFPLPHSPHVPPGLAPSRLVPPRFAPPRQRVSCAPTLFLSVKTLSLLLEVVSSTHGWKNSARVLREAGLLEQLLRVHSGGIAGHASISTARRVLVEMGLHDVDSAKRIRDEILAKVS